MATLLLVDIVSSHDGEIFSGEAEMVFAMAELGEVGISVHHAPLISPLKPGMVRIKLNEKKMLHFQISGGVLEVQPHHVIVLADIATQIHTELVVLGVE
jgi:F-type H+-transporting ATPase subunit epsilon